MKVTLTTNDLIAAAGAIVVLFSLAALHWATVGTALGLGAIGVAIWRQRREPPDRDPGAE